MAFQPVPDTAQALMRYTSLDGSRFLGANVWNFTFASGAPSTADLTNLGTTIADVWVENFAPLVPQGVVLASIELTSLTSEAAPYDLVIVAEQGEVATPVLPANVTLAVSMRTGTTGRSRRGRFYWIQLGESQVGGNTVETSVLNGIRTACETLQAAVQVEEWNWSILSRVTGGVQRPEGVTFPITAWGFTDALVDTQRRRVLRGNP